MRSRVDAREYLIFKRADSDVAADTLARLHAKARRVMAAMARDVPDE